MSTSRKPPDVRKDEIVLAALDLAEKRGYMNVTRDEIADRVGVSGAAVSYHFRTMAQLRRCVMRAAVREPRLAVLAQGLVARDPQALRAADAVRAQAIDTLR